MGRDFGRRMRGFSECMLSEELDFQSSSPLLSHAG